MPKPPMYHEGMRRLADRLEQVTVRYAFSDDDRTLAFPDYDGNGMYRSRGNVLVNPHVGLLFLDFEQPRRMRVNGTASIDDDDALRAEFTGAVFVVRVRAERIFPNCPRYIHRMRVVEHSAYAPRPDATAPVPDWKRYEVFRDALPERDRPDTDDTRDDT